MKISEKKKDMIKEILGHIDDNYAPNSAVYVTCKKALDKLAVYELASLISMLETSFLAKKKGR